MEQVETRAKDWFAAGATGLLVVMSLPLLATGVIALRAVLLLTIPVVAVLGLLAYAISPLFREWLNAQGELRIGDRGLKLATDVAFHPSHSWARMEGEVVVGVDDVAQAALGPIEEVELPHDGTRVRRGDLLSLAA